uniref:tRNA modification GTPase MnmE n=1 Tax=Magnetococcus massalia (strain MO-1) TaxID=451514 RepID=A0A1S7LN98_MAGMO|nr:tRNA modification GTPase mnmE [Candidatus Magnetococcus massalia]
MLRKPKLHQQDTIIGIATPPGHSGVGVIRLSGPDALTLVLPHLKTPSGKVLDADGFSPRVMRRVDFIDPDHPDVPLDHILAVYFAAPRSFSGEHMAELHGHGSPILMQRIMEILIDGGVRPAEPGEFSKRAFLNDKMDLVQAEALMGLIEASTLRAAREASRQMSGSLSRKLEALKEQLVDIYAHMEAELDFSDEDIEPDGENQLQNRLEKLLQEVQSMLTHAELGRQLKEGFQLAIVGRPNVGKSSLFNTLSGEEKAIVTDIAGTTRDINENRLEINGVPIILVDMAGLRESNDPVEQIGIERARQRIELVDGFLFLAEAHRGVTTEDRALLPKIDAERTVWVWNKADLMQGEAPVSGVELLHAECLASIKRGTGLDTIVEAVSRLIQEVPEEGEGAITLMIRQREGLKMVERNLLDAVDRMNNGEWFELVAEPVAKSIDSFNGLIGNTDIETVYSKIFNSFCVGK